MSDKIINEINEYYTNKVLIHGTTPKGVDWNGLDSQEKRFEQLLKVVADNDKNSVLLDYGCGFGSLFAYLNKSSTQLNYVGFDISNEMLKKAIELHGEKINWLNKVEENFKVDYVVASGLFNVKLDQSNEEWQIYVKETLDKINNISRKGFAFNILTKYSDEEFMKDYLFYASPEYYFKYCKLNFSKQISLLHDYGLFEFTILVRK
jgi:SAM-dependent methyltransferase